MKQDERGGQRRAGWKGAGGRRREEEGGRDQKGLAQAEEKAEQAEHSTDRMIRGKRQRTIKQSRENTRTNGEKKGLHKNESFAIQRTHPC